ncbi:MAG TPA: hypothetical protein VJV97_09255 [Gemmatimonadaceae bacterium]|nr:hypothetical protein [Gemmatimonadaceae bacterium]
MDNRVRKLKRHPRHQWRKFAAKRAQKENEIGHLRDELELAPRGHVRYTPIAGGLVRKRFRNAGQKS